MTRHQPTTPGATHPVRHFRQILLWPLQLMPDRESGSIHRHWERLGEENKPWFEVNDEFHVDPAHFQARHYSEFVTFLPSVQRFLYGEGGANRCHNSPIRVLRRADLKTVHLTFKEGNAPVTLSIAHIDLYFFYDIDVVILAVEVFADDLDLMVIQELLFRFGRTFPPGWDDQGLGDHCLAKVEWLDREGQVVIASDYENRAKFLSFVCRERSAGISADWEYLLAPMVHHTSSRAGGLRYRQLEYGRMPMMAYLAVDDPSTLSRADFVRLVLGTRGDPDDLAPCSERFLANFEAEYCHDRYWQVANPKVPDTRFLCSGHAFITVGEAGSKFFTDSERGVLAQFRHQYFLLGLIAHFHKAALLMFGDRLGAAVTRLEIRDPESVKQFKRVIRKQFATFLRFTHRYWFHEVSIQSPAKALFAMYRRHHGTDSLFNDIRLEVQDMAQYLENDGLRRQANTVVRLTVVTTFGLIGTVTTGFLGMNLLAEADAPLSTKLLYFILTLIPSTIITLYTVMISKRMADLLEVLSDERLTLRKKLGFFTGTWKGGGE
ncbi:CorA-like Mg2+ transporter protein [uncultured Gammaproteobacteria bacterium]